MTDQYKTISSRSTGDYRERGSKFLAYAYPCPTEEALKACISDLKKEHPSARHFCFGAIIGSEQPQERQSDDGEPGGTAGLPILNQIHSAELRSVLVVVVRYFGGTKLGKAGLIQAYKESTRLALEAAPIVTRVVSRSVRVDFSYDDTSSVMPLIERFEGAEITQQEYTASCSVVVSVPKSSLDKALHLFDHLPEVNVCALD